MFKTKKFWCGLSCLGVCVMLIGNSAGTILEKNRNMVNSYLGTQTAVVEVSESDDALYTTYVADYANTDELIAAHRAMGERLSAEGSVLLKSSTDFLIILAPLRKCRNCLDYQAFPAFCVSEDTPHIMAYRSLIWRSKVVKP